MPSLACIIPVVGNTHGLETTLVSVLERRPDTCEVLVVLNVPYHDPYGLQGEIQILQAPPEAGIVDCVNLGISTTCAPVVHLLATGLEVNHGWIERALAHFDDPRVAAVTPLIYDRANHEQLLAAGVSYGWGGRKNVHRSVPAEGEFSCAPIGPLVQAAFYRKSALDALGGGLPIDVGDHLADVDLLLSLRQAGWRLELEPDSQVFASSIDDQLPGGFSTGLWSERLYWRHFTEAGKLAGLFSHPLVVLQELIKSKPPWKATAQFIGRLVALCQPGHYRKHQQMLTASRNDARAEQAQWQTNLEVAAGSSRVPSAKQHRVDTPHQGVKPQNSSQQRHAYRRKKRH